MVLRLCISVVGCLALCVSASGAQIKRDERPNILVAIADDWGWPHAGAYGDPVVKTPTFDRIAREGVLFTHAFCSSPSCSPSRAALLTGQWHWRLEEGANLWGTLPVKFPAYPDILAEAGYHVGHTGKGWGPGRYDVGGYKHNPAGPMHRDFEAFLAARPRGKPWCFWFGGRDPHRPYMKGSGKRAGIPLDKIKLPACLPDNADVRGDVADYYGAVQRFDSDVGKLLAKLDELGEADDTLVVITSDNGMPFPRGKANLYDAGARVPLAMRWSRGIKGKARGREVSDFASLADLAPTFVAIAERTPGVAMTGRSLLDILRSEKSPRVEAARDHVLIGKERHVPCQERNDSGGTPMRAIRTDKFLYVRNFTPDRWPAGTPQYDKAFRYGVWYGDCDNGPTKSVLIDRRDDPPIKRFYELAFAKRPAEELYDLQKDEGQLHNVAEDAAYAAAKKELADRLLTELKATADPRVLGGGEKFDKYAYYGSGPMHPKIEGKQPKRQAPKSK
jgi:N-sulfoglucosamine sulfohydrolase